MAMTIRLVAKPELVVTADFCHRPVHVRYPVPPRALLDRARSHPPSPQDRRESLVFCHYSVATATLRERSLRVSPAL